SDLIMHALAAHYRFDVEMPWKNLPEKARQAVLYGSGEDEIEFRHIDSRGRTAKRSHPFEGILPNMERRYKETDSATVREELGRFRGTRRCVECGGARLNLTARHVHVAGHTLPQVSELSVARALEHHEGLAASGWRGGSAARSVKGGGTPPRLRGDVGPD